MWMKKGGDLVAPLFGPCTFSARIKGADILIREITNYPDENAISFKIMVSKPERFAIRIRKPAWADGVRVSANYILENGFIVLDKKWSIKDSFDIRFAAKVVQKEAAPGEYYFSYGPLVLAHPIAGTEKVTKRYSTGGLKDMEIRPVNLAVYQDASKPVKRTKTPGKGRDGLKFSAEAYNPVSDRKDQLVLEPMGKTILRQVTFKKR